MAIGDPEGPSLATVSLEQANEYGNFVLVVPADSRPQILKSFLVVLLVLVLVLVLIVGPKLFIEPGTKAPALFKLLSVSDRGL